MRGLAVELARVGVRVNGIAPGYIRTAQALSEEHSLGPEGLEQAAEFIPIGRVGEPDDIADVILFLASEAARYITGQVLVVDGGLLVGRYEVAIIFFSMPTPAASARSYSSGTVAES